MRFLLTGGAGYLGTALAELLLQEEHWVIVLDDLSRPGASPMHLIGRQRYEFIRGDSRDEATVRRLLKSVDVVVPLAGVVGQAACDADRTRAETTNIGAIQTLMSLRSREQRIVFPATNSGYGTRTGEPECDEESPLQPVSLYGRSKVDAESWVLESPNAVSLRFATLFGVTASMRWDLLVNAFVRDAVQRRAIVVFEGAFRRNYVHVRDAARAIYWAAEGPDDRPLERRPIKDGAYNVGSIRATKRELAKMVAEVSDCQVLEGDVGRDPDRRDYLVSTAKIDGTGFREEHNLRDGIREVKAAVEAIR